MPLDIIQLRKKIVGKVQINTVGVISKEEKSEANDLIKATLLNVIEGKKFESLREFQNVCRQAIRKRIFKVFSKEPIVVVSAVSTQ